MNNDLGTATLEVPGDQTPAIAAPLVLATGASSLEVVELIRAAGAERAAIERQLHQTPVLSLEGLAGVIRALLQRAAATSNLGDAASVTRLGVLLKLSIDYERLIEHRLERQLAERKYLDKKQERAEEALAAAQSGLTREFLGALDHGMNLAETAAAAPEPGQALSAAVPVPSHEPAPPQR
jgi:hypothetical protein